MKHYCQKLKKINEEYHRKFKFFEGHIYVVSKYGVYIHVYQHTRSKYSTISKPLFVNNKYQINIDSNIPLPKNY